MLCTFKFARRSGICAAAVLSATLLIQISPAFAQSTGTQEVEDILVVAKKRDSIGGTINPETAAKSRSTVTQEYIVTQTAGQSVIQSINLLPGVSFTNNDPYGSSGGNLRLRSYDNNRISLTLDGMPLNDTGNYAIFTNQQLDPEIIGQTTVNLGTTDVDSPTAAATGGTINIVSSNPEEGPGLVFQPSYGSFDYRRFFGRVDTGEIADTGLSAYFTASYQKYDKFKGPGTLEKKQLNGKIRSEFADGDFISLAFHYNKNRNDFYRNISLAELAANGFDFDNNPTCVRDAPSPGVADNDGSGVSTNPLSPNGCTNFYKLRINPSNTGNLRGQSSFGLTDNLRLTVDPSFQYVLANGGGTTVVSETDTRVRGALLAAGRDLNGDGDILDSVRLYTPNNTNTRRYGLTTSLIYNLLEDHVIRVAYTLDYGRHRQTGQFGPLASDGTPENVFAGKEGLSVLSADGVDLRGRDRYSKAILNQGAISYDGAFFDRMVRLSVGVRAPFFRRDLNQFCYTNTAAGAANAGQFCTTQTVSATFPDGTVTLNGSGATRFVPPYKGTKKYDKILPNVGISWTPWEQHQFYVSFAEGLAVPRTDNLYSLQILDVQPETTKSYDVGYRYQSSDILVSAALWKSDFKNRIVSANDPITNVAFDRNLGNVKIWGVDAEIGVQPIEDLSFYGSVSYNNSEVQDNILNGAIVIPTAGKELVETPNWTFAGRAQYTIMGVTLGMQAKYVGERWATDANDQEAPSYVTADANVSYDLGELGFDGSFVQFNVINLFDKDYLGSIPTTRFDATNPGSQPLYAVGAPRTLQVTLRAKL